MTVYCADIVDSAKHALMTSIYTVSQKNCVAFILTVILVNIGGF